MFFRSSRRSSHNSSRSSSITASTPTSSQSASRTRHDRPHSAPAVPVLSTSGNATTSVTDVEQRLRIIKRSRASSKRGAVDVGQSPASSGELSATTASNISGGGAMASQLPTSVPPCKAYPTYNLSRLPKHEQHVLVSMVGECLDVVLFPQAVEMGN